jgi:hypothetical protein
LHNYCIVQATLHHFDYGIVRKRLLRQCSTSKETCSNYRGMKFHEILFLRFRRNVHEGR